MPFDAMHGRLKDGTVKCFGYGRNGRLGNDSTSGTGSSPGDMAALGTVNLGQNALALSAGDGHTCALLCDGTIKVSE